MPQDADKLGNISQETANAATLPVVSEYNRRESPTQPPADAVQQKLSMEIWGKPAQGSSIPSVKAYRENILPLAQHGPRGIRFTTDTAPTPGSGKPFEARWYEGTQGVDKKASGVVAIKVLSLLNFQP
jgi:hypothetical protein